MHPLHFSPHLLSLFLSLLHSLFQVFPFPFLGLNGSKVLIILTSCVTTFSSSNFRYVRSLISTKSLVKYYQLVLASLFQLSRVQRVTYTLERIKLGRYRSVHALVFPILWRKISRIRMFFSLKPSLSKGESSLKAHQLIRMSSSQRSQGTNRQTRKLTH